MELIRVENVFKTYHVGEIDVPVLKGVSLSIRRGEMVALMGASGSGKSTLMNILGCLDRPTSGSYWLDGQDVGSLSANERAVVRTAKLGFVFQSFNLLPRTTAVNNVLMPLDYSTNAPSAGKALARSHEWLDRVGLQSRLDHVPSQMSGGQQQRVAIARALINQPAVLLADEPTGNLDSHTSVEILEMFQELNRTAGITVILVTHDPNVAAYAHRTIQVVDGHIEEDTARPEVPSEPNDDDILRSDSRHSDSRNTDVRHNAPSGHGVAHAHSQRLDGNGDWSGPMAARRDGGGLAVGTAPCRTVRGTTAAQLVAQGVEVKIHPAEVKPTVAERDEPQSNWLRSLALALLPSTLRTAISALRRNKMRSALTTIGIVIGVAAVIAMVEISQGSKAALEATMSTMGANNLLIQSGAAASGGISFGFGSQKTLTPDDAEQIGLQCPAIAGVAPIVQVSGQVVRGNRNWIPMAIYGTTPSYLKVRDWNGMEEGDMFTDRDVRGAIKVCVIGVTLARELFEGESPIGKDIRVKNVSLRVVGVLAKKGANMMGMDQDDLILAPWTTVKYRISGNNTGGASGGTTTSSTTASSAASTAVNTLSELYPGGTTLYPEQSATEAANYPQPVRFVNVDQIFAKAASAEAIPAAMAQVTALLRERHHLRADADDDFNLRDMSEIIKALGSMSQMMGGLLLIVALISLAVGGVGIMNIMLVSVTERTREIGLRMAVGARSYHILRQFLIEAVVLCLFGGLAGILLGRSVATLVWYFLRWPIQASLPAIAAAFIVSAIVGIAFGFYPAWKASRLDPIDALRYE
ncbi:MAG: ABC transporter permease [Pirellulales bacterium]